MLFDVLVDRQKSFLTLMACRMQKGAGRHFDLGRRR